MRIFTTAMLFGACASFAAAAEPYRCPSGVTVTRVVSVFSYDGADPSDAVLCRVSSNGQTNLSYFAIWNNNKFGKSTALAAIKVLADGVGASAEAFTYQVAGDSYDSRVIVRFEALEPLKIGQETRKVRRLSYTSRSDSGRFEMLEQYSLDQASGTFVAYSCEVIRGQAQCKFPNWVATRLVIAP